MKIGVTSQNKIKLDAVRSAYSFLENYEVVGYSADSGVGEQPVGDETVIGARNRIWDVSRRIDNLDRIISIENGIFEEDGRWLDKAVVMWFNPRTGEEHIAYSDSVEFPKEYVEKARSLGFDTTTVGSVMAEAGYIENPKDPHMSISGKPRRDYIEKTVASLVRLVEPE